MKILTEIIEKRKNLIAEKGHTQGESIPLKRKVPIVPFLGKSGLICEVKRKSPSRADINTGLDPAATAEMYTSRGVTNISVLTEPNYFGGSLTDLITIKKNFPDTAVLRKDFIIDKEDIDIAYRAGADAVLLIAAVHDVSVLQDLYAYADNKGLAVLFEVHDLHDLEKAAKVKPKILGINTRDLRTFIIDPTVPLRLSAHVNWDCRLVFESGIHSGQQASFAAACGASALLVGESVVKNPDLIGEILAGFRETGNADFWKKLFSRTSRPLVKICGITRQEDLVYADKLGADIIGLIFADSPRRISVNAAAGLPETKALKAGVVVTGTDKPIPDDILELLDKGRLDVLQLHGTLDKQFLPAGNANLYQAVSVKDELSVDAAAESSYPRVLLDAFSPGLHGGTGKLLDESLVTKAAGLMPLWLAGGLNPENAAGIIRKFHPELIDAASGLEASPGIKDHSKMEAYFNEINSATEEHNNELK